jgi:hypothetical protein
MLLYDHIINTHSVYSLEDTVESKGDVYVFGRARYNKLIVRGNLGVHGVLKVKELVLYGHLVTNFEIRAEKIIAWGTPTTWLAGAFIDGRQVTFSEKKIKISCKAFTIDQWAKMTETRLSMWSKDGFSWLSKNREALLNAHKAFVEFHKKEM